MIHAFDPPTAHYMIFLKLDVYIEWLTVELLKLMTLSDYVCKIQYLKMTPYTSLP